METYQEIEDYDFDFILEKHSASEYKMKLEELSGFDFNRVECVFQSSKRRLATVKRIYRVHNALLKEAYEIKKQQMQSEGVYPREETLFHGTRQENVQDICKYGFDYRKTGSNYGHKFGQGISFATKSEYASHYGSCENGEKCMFIVKVLVGRECVGNNLMQYPTFGCDTSIKPNGEVVVKYDDNTCYPEYLIYYSP